MPVDLNAHRTVVWERWGLQGHQQRDRMPAMPVGSPDSRLVVVGKNYGPGPAGVPFNAVCFDQAVACSQASCLGCVPVDVFGMGNTVSCYFVYYGIWLYCAKELQNVEPLFCEIFPVFSERSQPHYRDSEAMKETVKLLCSLSTKQVIILNGWSPREYQEVLGDIGFFAEDSNLTNCLRELLPDNFGVAPPNRLAFVTKCRHLCLPTYHSSGAGQYLRLGHLLSALQTCLTFADQL